MTLEEAQQLKPGDIIIGDWGSSGGRERTITKVWIDPVYTGYLRWNQPDSGIEHQYEWHRITLVKSAEPVVLNNYPIY